MPKTILIFSDGTGQIGGLRPDQRLSNVYKMYRAMRPGPDSWIDPCDQVAFYDPGLGAGEVGGLTFRRLRNILAAAVGTGIDENVIDCYEAVLKHHEAGDRVLLFGFSRGAYTVRSLANVMNLCGVPTRDGAGRPLPRHGPGLRKIASDAVRYVYNHGAGKKRATYETEREAKAQRFRTKYGSDGVGADGEPQGNVQPHFVGVFDTVASLGSRTATILAAIGLVALLGLCARAWNEWSSWIAVPLTVLPVFAVYWVARAWLSQFKYFFPDPARKVRWWNPLDWAAAWRHGHMAWWTGKHYDRYIDREVPHLRHALAIDEDRAKFPRVGWGRAEDVAWHEERGNPDWIKQVWFAGNHSDIGGSYPEDESRLSDIALRWMVDELAAIYPDAVRIRKEVLQTAADPTGLQHDERIAVLNKQPVVVRWIFGDQLTWSRNARYVYEEAPLHSSVIARFEAALVPQMNEVKPYRPANLRNHETVKQFYS